MSKKKLSPEIQAIISASDAGLLTTTVKLVEAYLVDNPSSIRGWLDLGQALLQLGRYEAAEDALHKVIELDGSQSGPIYGEIGNLFRAKGDYETAGQWYQKQIESDPGDPIGHLYLGNLLMRKGDFANATQSLKTALACENVCLEEVHYSLGLAYRGAGELVEAKRHFEAALTYDSAFADAKVALKDVRLSLR